MWKVKAVQKSVTSLKQKPLLPSICLINTEHMKSSIKQLIFRSLLIDQQSLSDQHTDQQTDTDKRLKTLSIPILFRPHLSNLSFFPVFFFFFLRFCFVQIIFLSFSVHFNLPLFFFFLQLKLQYYYEQKKKKEQTVFFT